MSDNVIEAAPKQQVLEGTVVGTAQSGLPTSPQLGLIENKDFQATAEMLADAFVDKQGRCCCALVCSRSASITEQLKSFQQTAQNYPEKLKRCAVVRDVDGSIIGYCALQSQGDPGNLAMPEFIRHKLSPGEVYLEQIGVSDKARGKGIGKKLMEWAEDMARSLGAKYISLDVMAANRARSLYERQGYVITPSPEGEGPCELCISGCIIWCCMGCRYCRAYYMVKQLA